MRRPQGGKEFEVEHAEIAKCREGERWREQYQLDREGHDAAFAWRLDVKEDGGGD